MGAARVYSQDAFRGRLDDGSETTATFKPALNTMWTQALGQTFRVRFLISSLAAGSDDNGIFTLHESHNNGTFTVIDITTGSKTKPSIFSSIAHGSATTQQIGSGTFNNAVNTCMIGNGSFASCPSFTFKQNAGTTEMEMEFALTIPPGNVSNGDTLEYRVYENASDVFLGSYNEFPILTIVKGGLRISGGIVTIRNNS